MLPALLTAFAFFATIVVQNPRGNPDMELQGFNFFLDATLICVFSKFIVVHLGGDTYVAYPFPTSSNSPAASVPLGLPLLSPSEDDGVACTDLAIRSTTDLLVYVPTPKLLDALPPRSAMITGLLALPASGDDEVACTDLIAYIGTLMVLDALPPRPAPVAGLIPSPTLPVLPASEDDKVACTNLAICGPMDLIVYVGTQNVLDVLPPWPALVAGSLPSTVVSINSSGIIGGKLGPATCPALIDAPSGSIPSDTSNSNIVKASNNTIVETSKNNLLKELSGISLSLIIRLISFGVVLGVVLGFITTCIYYSAKCVAHLVFKCATHYLDRSSSPCSVSIFLSLVIIFIGVSATYMLIDDTPLVMILDTPAFLLAALLPTMRFSVLTLFGVSRSHRHVNSSS